MLSPGIEVPAIGRAGSPEPVEPPGSDAQQVVEAVSHRFVAGAEGALTVDDGAYRAELGFPYAAPSPTRDGATAM